MEPSRRPDCIPEKTLSLPSASAARAAGFRLAQQLQRGFRSRPLIGAVVVLAPTLAAGLSAAAVLASGSYPFQGLPSLPATGRIGAAHARPHGLDGDLFTVSRRGKVSRRAKTGTHSGARLAGENPPSSTSATRNDGVREAPHQSSRSRYHERDHLRDHLRDHERHHEEDDDGDASEGDG